MNNNENSIMMMTLLIIVEESGLCWVMGMGYVIKFLAYAPQNKLGHHLENMNVDDMQ